jgi:hypothetical protein
VAAGSRNIAVPCRPDGEPVGPPTNDGIGPSGPAATRAGVGRCTRGSSGEADDRGTASRTATALWIEPTSEPAPARDAVSAGRTSFRGLGDVDQVQ